MNREDLEKEFVTMFGVTFSRHEVQAWEEREREVVLSKSKQIHRYGFLKLRKRTIETAGTGRLVGVSVIFKGNNRGECWIHNPDMKTPFTKKDFDEIFFNV